jgi:[acyl-carrier-protein] S-malonyltransferase
MSSRALVFAGQGAQKVGMGADLAEAYPECRELYDRADAALGYSLSDICFNGPDEALTKSNHCQPAIFVTSLACQKALATQMPDLSFAATAGLSLGEWSALCFAGVLSFEDALRALEARGRFMQEACDAQAGGMVSVIGLDRATLGSICDATHVQMANINSAEQIVLSGPKDQITQAAERCTEAGAKKTIVLNVAGAFHSRLMQPAADALADFLADMTFNAPRIPVVANVTAEPHGDPDAIRRVMIEQVTQSVDWVGSIGWFSANGVVAYVEAGPGRVLSGLIKRIDRQAGLANVQDVASLEASVEKLKTDES